MSRLHCFLAAASLFLFSFSMDVSAQAKVDEQSPPTSQNIFEGSFGGSKSLIAVMRKGSAEPTVRVVFTTSPEKFEYGRPLFAAVTAKLSDDGYQYLRITDITRAMCMVRISVVPPMQGKGETLMADVGCEQKAKPLVVMRLVNFSGSTDLTAGSNLIPDLVAQAHAEALKLQK